MAVSRFSVTWSVVCDSSEPVRASDVRSAPGLVPEALRTCHVPIDRVRDKNNLLPTAFERPHTRHGQEQLRALYKKENQLHLNESACRLCGCEVVVRLMPGQGLQLRHSPRPECV
jgi:hypothetical protein